MKCREAKKGYISLVIKALKVNNSTTLGLPELDDTFLAGCRAKRYPPGGGCGLLLLNRDLEFCNKKMMLQPL